MQQDKWYDQPKWKRIRAKVMRRDCYVDQVAKRYGIMLPAEIVHHIFPKDDYPEYAFEPWNLVSVSRKTHNELHDRETDELTEKGRDLLRRTCLKTGKPIPEEFQGVKKRGTFKKRDKYYT